MIYTTKQIRIFTVLISFLISVIAFYSSDILNRDGMFYMDIASAYTQEGLTGILQYTTFGWPFSSIVVAHIHQVTQLSFESSAIVLNTLLFVLLTDALVLISNKMLPNTRQVALATLFFLCFLTLNEYRSFIGRDVGYWAFCSLALYQFIQYIEKPSVQKAIHWQLAMIIAILFRVDGVVILLGLPFYLFVVQSPKQAFKHCFQLFYLIIISAFVALFISVDQSSLSSVFSKITTVTKYINPDSVLTKFNFNAELIGSQVLNKYSAEYSGLILSSGLIIMLTYKLLNAITIGYIGLYLFSWLRHVRPQPAPYRHLIGYFLVLNIVILVGFIFTEYFVSRRYTLLAVISLLLLMLPRLCDLLERAWLSKNKSILMVAGIILLVSLADSMIKSNSKLYIKEAAIWASRNLPENSAVLTDSRTIQYYFNSHNPAASLTSTNEIYGFHNHEYLDSYQNYDYLIIVEKPKYKELKEKLSTLSIEPIFHLDNKRKHGRRVTIYAVKPQNKSQ